MNVGLSYRILKTNMHIINVHYYKKLEGINVYCVKSIYINI